MCIRDRGWSSPQIIPLNDLTMHPATLALHYGQTVFEGMKACLLYTSDAADERSSVDLGGRRIIKKKTTTSLTHVPTSKAQY